MTESGDSQYERALQGKQPHDRSNDKMWDEYTGGHTLNRVERGAEQVKAGIRNTAAGVGGAAKGAAKKGLGWAKDEWNRRHSDEYIKEQHTKTVQSNARKIEVMRQQTEMKRLEAKQAKYTGRPSSGGGNLNSPMFSGQGVPSIFGDSRPNNGGQLPGIFGGSYASGGKLPAIFGDGQPNGGRPGILGDEPVLKPKTRRRRKNRKSRR